MRALVERLELCFRRVQGGDVASFSNLDAAFEKNKVNLDAELKAEIKAHLQSLKQKFERYFPDLAETDFPESKLGRNPFLVKTGLFQTKYRKNFLELNATLLPKMTLKQCFSITSRLNTCGCTRISVMLLCVPTTFSATYTCR